MVLIIFSLTLLFLCIGFLADTSTQQVTNPLSFYFSHQFSFMLNYKGIFIVGFIFLTLLNYKGIFIVGFIFLTLLFFKFNFDKKNSFHKIFFYSASQTILIGFFGILLSYVLLFVIAGFHLITVGVLLEKNPKALGIVFEKEAVVTRLKIQNHPPEIIAIDHDPSEVVRAVARATSGPKTFYGSTVLKSIPHIFILAPEKINVDLLMIDNTIIITAISPSDLEAISPAVGYQLVKNYFKSRQIRMYPVVTILNREEYEEYRKEDAKKKIVKIDQQMEKIEDYISSLSASLETQKRRDKEKEKLLAEYQYYFNFFTNQRTALSSLKQSTPHELGVFENRDEIKLVYDTDNAHAIANYFATLTHEYLHYASFVNEERRFENSFFEEGLTEYFTRAAMKDALQADTNLGYPVQAKIISEMMNMIPESELAEIYFTKDEVALQKALDRVYGDGFYQNNQVIFETLQYTSSPKQALKLANDIMKRIEGEPLTEKDLKSNFSSL
jgi:hypothetical protein